jgi:phenylpyruvate tautomerase PptA (4-oxalocrotonate tautomerase family)
MSITRHRTITTDPIAPTVSIAYPVDGTTYGADWTGTITGTASAAAGTTVTNTQVAIEDTKTDVWWDGTSFSASTQTFVAATGTTTWMLSLAAQSLVPGDTYTVVAQATDSLGNLGTSSTVSFTYIIPTAPPTVVVTYPVDGTTYGPNWTGTITGTASFNSGPGSTIKGTRVAIEDTSTKLWWSGSSFSVGTQTFVAATGNTTWMLAMPANDLSSGGTYKVVAEATDSLGKVGTSSTVTFTYTPQPTVTITYPVDGTTYGADWTGTITGTASAGPGATISSISVAIEDTTTKQWWSGSSFNDNSQTFVKATGTTTWYLPLKAGSLTSDDSYAVVAQTADSVGNLGTSSTVKFTYTVPPTQPTITITYPVDGTTYGADWTGTILGTASSGASTTIASTQVAIEDTSATRWWNGTAFAASSQTFVAATGNTTWLLALAAENLTAGDSYSVVAQATDSAGNLGTSSTVSFTYGSTAQALGASHG